MTTLGDQSTCGSFILKVMKITLHLSTALLAVIFWPFWMLITRFVSTWKYAIAAPQKKFDMHSKINEDMAVSSRAMIIEVAIESSFEPLLQLYILFPTLFKQYLCYHETSEINEMFCQILQCESHHEHKVRGRTFLGEL